MAENVGVKTRHQTKKLKEGSQTRECNDKRRSYPPDQWTQDDDEDSGIKQRRTLSVREQNTACEKIEEEACQAECAAPPRPRGARPKIADRFRAAQGQSVSAPAVAVKKKQKGDPEYQILLSALEHHADSPYEVIEISSSPCEPVSPVTPVNTPAPVPAGIADIDSQPDTLTTHEYAREVMDYLMYLETLHVLKPDFMDRSPDVTTRMRGVLMDWILQVQVHEELKEETLHLTVYLVDLTLSMQEVMMSKLQLVGITCLLIASKYHERFAPEINVLCYLTENTFTPEQVTNFEIFLLQMLDFRLGAPVTTVFLDRYLQVHAAAREVEHLAAYINDLHVTAAALSSVLPSLRAAATLYLARFLLLPIGTAWDAALTFYTTYCIDDLTECARELAVLLIKAPTSKYQGARNRYNSPEFLHISAHAHVAPAHILHVCFGQEVQSNTDG